MGSLGLNVHGLPRAGVLALGLAALSACAMPPGAEGPIDSRPRTAVEDAATATAPAAPGPDTLVTLYAEVEGGLTASGRMRRDTAPSDAPFTVEDLVRNFERIALYDEYVEIGGRFIQAETPALLRRWNRPVRVGVVTGALLPERKSLRDRAHVAAFTQRLARLTGLDMRMDDGNDVNYLVLVLSTKEQRIFATEAATRYSQFEPAVSDALRDAPLDTFCTAYAFADPQDPSLYAAVMVLVRAEHPPLTRLSCIHEEMAQAMGLPNDSPDARPSLFNDNLEFAFLTEHDEILLRMLYDPRLRPGMSAEEARPLLPEIARDAIKALRRKDDAPGPRAGA